MKKKKEHHEEHVDETWLIPYSDMLTLLLALFIVMFAMSKVDTEKMAKASQQFNTIFMGGSSIANSGSSGSAPVEKASITVGESNSQAEEDKMLEVKKNLESDIESKGYGDKVKVALNKDGLEIDIQDVILFKSGDAVVLKEVNPLLTEISKVISGLDNSIKITGHTDNQPIKNSQYRSNWDLSAMRAINVMQFMSSTGGLNPNKFSIQAYGEFMPKFDNATEDGRAKNRRVEISIARKYPAAEKASNIVGEQK